MNLFYNPDDLRLRSGWRLLIQWLLMIIIIGLISLLLPDVMHTHFTMTLTIGSAIILSVWFSIRMLDRKQVASYGLKIDKLWRNEWLYGLAMGTGAMAFIFVFEWMMGWVSITGFGWERISQTPYIIHIGGYLLSNIFVGFYEEYMFRGYQITNLFEGIHGRRFDKKQAAYGAIIVSSIVFGLMHLGNPNATWLSTTNIVAAGIMLALPFVLTGRLAMSIGIHMAWNFFQGGVFGFAVSGMPFRYSLIQTSQSGPQLWTGGFFGPEAGFAGVAGILLLIAVQLLYVKRLRSDNKIHGENVIALDSANVSGNMNEN
jgi:membrane protease YdiL (CAAX protease family)